jgi:hypothetical protein
MTKPVFVLITSGQCGHCVNFLKDGWKDMRSALEHLGTVKVKHIDLPKGGRIDRDSQTGEKYPDDINRFIRWYPTILLVDGNSWERGDKLDSVVVFNGVMKDGELVGNNSANPMTTSGVKNWISENLATVSSGHSYRGGASEHKSKSDHEKRYVPTSCSKVKYKPKSY